MTTIKYIYLAVSLLFSTIALAQQGRLVISEVFYDTPLNEKEYDMTYIDGVYTSIAVYPETVVHHNGEFIELYNPTAYSIDISGWDINGFTFPMETIVGAKGMVLVVYKHAYSPNFTINNLFPNVSAPAPGSYIFYHNQFICRNSGAAITLMNESRIVVDKMSYRGRLCASCWNVRSAERYVKVHEQEQRLLYQADYIRLTSVSRITASEGLGKENEYRATKATPMEPQFYESSILLGNNALPDMTNVSTNMSYIRTYTFLNQCKAIHFNASTGHVTVTSTEPSGSIQVALSTTYYDGLGRPVQTVQPRFSPAGKDLVTSLEYDAFGRESKQYLPYARSASTVGAYVPAATALSEIQAFYGDDGARAFTEIHYEPSPLNRITQQLMPGVAWQEHPATIDYRTNTSPLNTWKTAENGGFVPLTYAVSQLFVTQTTDANGNPAREYKDKLGKVVMTENHDGSHWLKTRYIYDDYDLLKAVAPPQATSVNEAQYCYYYQHDYRHRVIKKKIPGADWVYLVYDKTDRLILSQDGNQRMRNEWTLHKYDNLGREIITGYYTTPASHDALQAEYRNIAVVERYTGSGLAGYSWNAAPVVSPPEQLLAVNYYDSYEWIADLDADDDIKEALQYKQIDDYDLPHTSAKGFLTGTMERTLSPDNSTSTDQLITTYYYDAYGRVLQSVATNHIDGIDRTSTKYDFRGNILQAMQQSTWVDANDDPKSLTLLKTITYDAIKRPTAASLKINNQPPTQIAAMEYDELGRMKLKKTARRCRNHYV
jgi:hypothetical protein